MLDRGQDTLSVNYFGAVTTLASLHPLLQGGEAPRAVAIGSVAAYNPPDEPLIALLLAGDEAAARAAAAEKDGLTLYSATKIALSRWYQKPIRRYETRPTASQPKKSWTKLFAITSISIAKVKSEM